MNSYRNCRYGKVGAAPKSIGMYLLTTMSSKIDSPSLSWPLMTVSFCPLCMVNHPWRDHAARNQLRMNAISPSSPGRGRARACSPRWLLFRLRWLARNCCLILNNPEENYCWNLGSSAESGVLGLQHAQSGPARTEYRLFGKK